jgi:hypothetical protein
MRTTDDELDWDFTVDFVCVGTGGAGLAATIAAVDSGASAFVAGGVGAAEGSLEAALAREVADDDTKAYFAALTADLDEYGVATTVDAVPVATISDFAPLSVDRPGKKDQVPPFHGGRLCNWAVECVASPYGVVQSKVVTDSETPQRKRSGTVVDIARIGMLDLEPHAPAPTLDDWLASVAHERGIEVQERTRLQRLVFEDGQVVGAVFDTLTATLAVRARFGVMLACDGSPGAAPSLAELVTRPVTAQVCLVREPLSRFSRIELHVAASRVPSYAAARSH